MSLLGINTRTAEEQCSSMTQLIVSIAGLASDLALYGCPSAAYASRKLPYFCNLAPHSVRSPGSNAELLE